MLVCALASTHTVVADSNRLDALTEQTLESMLSANWTAAIRQAEELVGSFPDYALGHLILAEAHTVSAMSEPLLSSLPTYSTTLIDLLLEARARVQQIEQPVDEVKRVRYRIPKALVQVGKHIDHVVLVDLHASNLYLFDTTTKMPRLIKQHYISSGSGGFGKVTEGDLKTPLGIYRIDGFRGDESLPALYGSGALMLNYPNALDRSFGRTGSGIWLHGNPRDNRSRSPRSSEGCVTMANDHLLDLHKHINLSRTTVVLTNSVQWQNENQVAIHQERFQELFDQYRNAWLNNDIADLVSIYTPNALPSNIRYSSSASARKVSSSNTNHSPSISPIGIELDSLAKMRSEDVTLMLTPTSSYANQTPHLIMEFNMIGSQSTRITLYWEQNETGFWQIRREEVDAGEI